MRTAACALLLMTSPALAEEPRTPWSSTVGREAASAAPLHGPLAPLYTACGPRSVALETLAARLAAGELPARTRPSASVLAREVSAAGLAQPWPRAWVRKGTAEQADARFQAWLAPERGVRRCGIAQAVDAHGTVTTAALSLDALAELEPLPRTVRVGAWVTIEAALAVDASEAAVVLLGPDGEPRRVLAALSGGVVRSRVNLDQPGAFTLQVVATLPSGPEPVVEARIFAGVEPSTESRVTTPLELPDEQILMRHLNASRRARGLPPLRRSRALDALAVEHAETMAAANALAHDSGRGDPVERLRRGGISANLVGENVARAADATLAHEALWESPSHRGNMLSPRFGRVGVGVVRNADGVWVTELFTD